MLSIVVCSTSPKVSLQFYENIKTTVGVEFELVTIDNSNNKYSIFEAYNLGQQKSVYPNICFVHEDVLFHTTNWGMKVVEHLNCSNTGFIGVAGGPIMPEVPASWIGTYSVFNLLQSDKSDKRRTKKRIKPIKYNQNTFEVVVLDGLFLCARKEIFNFLSFDEQFQGFHCYDLDICIQSSVNGFSNFVVYDILIEHFSRGTRDKSYFENLLFLYKKWENVFPITTDERKKFYLANTKKIEIKKLKDLVASLVSNGFEYLEIKRIYKFYFEKIQFKSFFFLRIYFNLSFYFYYILIRKTRINKKNSE